jgi:hypothetical protein
MVSLNVRGEFDAAWWSSILCNLHDLRCSKNLYVLSLNYFRDKLATLHTNTHTVRRTVMKGFPEGSCCGPGFWNVMYNALLNLDFPSHTKVIAFADDLAIMMKGNTLSEAEVFANSDLAKIEKWAKETKCSLVKTNLRQC